MMAKMFYTLDEAKSALGRNEEEIKHSRAKAGFVSSATDRA
jgi:hypothetical protein